MNSEQRLAVAEALALIDRMDDTDDGQVAYRVARRMLAEALGLSLHNYMLLKDKKDTVRPLYCPSQYERVER